MKRVDGGTRFGWSRVATALLLLLGLQGIYSACRAAPARAGDVPPGPFTLQNAFLARTLVVEDGRLRTTEIVNKRAGTRLVPLACPEFRLRISRGTHTTGTDVELTAADFTVVNADASARQATFDLRNEPHALSVRVSYELGEEDFYLRKHLQVKASKAVTLERIDVEALSVEDAHQPYTLKVIYARGKWSPGLGQPLYTTRSGMFFGVEFPAAYNFVDGKALHCGYLWGRELKTNTTYRAYPSVVGVSDDPAYNQDAFFAYIDRVRVRPLRLQIQYNSWFDFGRGVGKESFGRSVALINRKLATERGNRPLSAYVIDDGWQDCGRDVQWTDKAWKVNAKFDEDFATSRTAVKQTGSDLGLWLSPGCLFGSKSMVARYRAAGLEAMDDWMSLAGPKYMKLLEDRMAELTRQGVTYFKLDGLFGHLNLRNFELHGERYGIPHMPQLELEGVKAGDAKLNDARYDELKMYYLTAGTERLMRIFGQMAQTNPDVYIVISNGAYLSSWWLMWVDSVWMINAGDAAGGSSRTRELVYRDDRYHEIWVKEKTQFPMCAIFNHEPKKRKTGESKDVFRKYLYMNLSRGTGFIELYIKPAILKDYDWDVISEGLHWAYDVFPLFKRSRMHGGSPKAGEVYGYTAWDDNAGYVSVHNPTENAQPYRFVLDRAFGLKPDGCERFLLSSPMASSLTGLKTEYRVGEEISMELKPREIRILNFSEKPKDWSILKELQARTPEPPAPPAPEPVSIKDHPVLGVWEYTHADRPYSREFTKDGYCILKQGDSVNWKKLYEVVGKDRAMVGSHAHVLAGPDTMRIENRYTATRRK